MKRGAQKTAVLGRLVVEMLAGALAFLLSVGRKRLLDKGRGQWAAAERTTHCF